MKLSYVYVLRLKSGGLYIGCTMDIEARYKVHLAGQGSRTTSLDPPESIAYTETWPDTVAARRREAQLKKWSRAKKEALILGETGKLKDLARRYSRNN